MNLTARQSEYVASITSIFASTGRAVGTTAIATRMKVSKPTAHETLALLAKRGLIRREQIGKSPYGRYLPLRSTKRVEVIRTACDLLRQHDEHAAADQLALIA